MKRQIRYRTCWVATAVVVSLTSFWIAYQFGRRSVVHPQLATVYGLSMSPAFCGPAMRFQCDDCGYAFRITQQTADGNSIQLGPSLVCRACGNCIASGQPVPSDIARIVPIARANEAESHLRRWDVVAFQEHRFRPFSMKRIVGLPEETVDVANGELFINGRLLKKTIAEFDRIAITIYDSTKTDASNVWHSDSLNRLQANNGALRILTTTKSSVSFEPALQFSSMQKAVVTDVNPFDPFTRRVIHVVPDVVVTLDVRLADFAQLAILTSDGHHSWKAVFDFHQTKLHLLSDDRNVQSIDISPELWMDLATFRFGRLDGRILLLAGDEVLLEAPCTDFATPASIPPSVGLEFRAARDDVEFRRVMVQRDLYYVKNCPSTIASTLPRTLKRDEYFLIGDYSPVSLDSRHPEIGPVKKRQIVGKVELFRDSGGRAVGCAEQKFR